MPPGKAPVGRAVRAKGTARPAIKSFIAAVAGTRGQVRHTPVQSSSSSAALLHDDTPELLTLNRQIAEDWNDDPINFGPSFVPDFNVDHDHLELDELLDDANDILRPAPRRGMVRNSET
jgi:hypothetical protein